MKAYPTVNWRYYIQEKNALGGYSELDFNNSTTWPVQLAGREVA